MRIILFCFLVSAFLGTIQSCDEDKTEPASPLYKIGKKNYHDTEVFPDTQLRIYGKWNINSISGGIHGNGYNPDFDYLHIKQYGIYGFVKNDSLLEFGKLIPGQQTENDPGIPVFFEKDDSSASFFGDREKYIHFRGNDSVDLISPCCDRYNYHFQRKN